MAAESRLTYCLRVRFLSIRPSPRIERYLALIFGATIIAATCRAWAGMQTMAVEGGLWTGPNDAELVAYRHAAAWLWQHDLYGIALLAWGLIGLAALGPLAPASWRTRTEPAIAWGTGVLLLCGSYAIIALTLLKIPLSRFW